MRHLRTATMRRLAPVLLALAMTSGCATGSPPSILAHPHAALVQVDVYDRANGSTLPVYRKDGRHYIVGTPGHEYAVRIRNRTSSRVLVVTSVDGVNVISGETASTSQSGYVLDPWGFVEVKGWRKNLERTAAFFFTEHRNSYAARTGRPDHVGVIGVAVFRERQDAVSRHAPPFRSGRSARDHPFPGSAASDAAGPAEARETEARQERYRSDEESAKAASRLGTGHGRNESSRATLVSFERASDAPAEIVSLQYDRRENLAAIGVLPATPHVTGRAPRPFPGETRFVPDPPY